MRKTRKSSENKCTQIAPKLHLFYKKVSNFMRFYEKNFPFLLKTKKPVMRVMTGFRKGSFLLRKQDLNLRPSD
ncbi:MAG: hypothetical protein EAZ92_14965 [Candidatus Kapaibacterium sp.]|nr:MAG: hypothetical protein EAZ92_14965 [Candidatus Kapabacteria bacterium]